MKRIIFTLLAFSFVYFQLNAQHCSMASGPSVCVPADTATQPGLAPAADSLAPVVNGTTVTTVIQFQNFDTVRAEGTLFTIYALKIDTISNLPAGLCWASNIANDSFANKQDGCIALNGSVCAPPGQYRLNIAVTANVGSAQIPFNIPINGSAAGLYYYIRVNNPGDTVTPLDTTGEAAGTIPSFIPYGTEVANCATGITQIGAYINTLSVYPNPFTSQTTVSFNSDKSEMMTEKLTNILGSQVYSRNMNVAMGPNTHTIERGSLSPGVYFYTISDGKSVYTKRLVITE